jgi:hypothetical protein
MTYHYVLPSILACSVERWTGFGEMPSSAAEEFLSMLLYSNSPAAEDGISPKPDKQESTEGHRGKHCYY